MVIADPCKQVLPEPGGPDGWYQDGALALLDEAACHLGSSREELALALVDKRQACAYENKHDAARKFFNLGERYERWRDYRVDPHGVGLHGLELAPGEVVRLTQEEVEAHPAWHGFGGQAPFHPPMRGWLASALCGEDGRSYGLLQLSDKAGGEDFTEKDADCLRELAEFAGATLDAFRAAKRAA